jgi:uncharacterized protein with GYD domain
MPVYIFLIKYTDQGIKNIKDILKYQEEAIKRGENMGIKVKGLYHVMGEYDVILIAECPSDETAVVSALAACSDGNIRTRTLKAFKQEEFVEIVNKLP